MNSKELNDIIEHYANQLISSRAGQDVENELGRLFSQNYENSEFGDSVMEDVMNTCANPAPEVERFSTLYLDDRAINKIVYHEDNNFEHSLVLRNGEVYQNKRSVLACDETPIAINRQQVCKLIKALEKVLELDLVND